MTVPSPVAPPRAAGQLLTGCAIVRAADALKSSPGSFPLTAQIPQVPDDARCAASFRLIHCKPATQYTVWPPPACAVRTDGNDGFPTLDDSLRMTRLREAGTEAGLALVLEDLGGTDEGRGIATLARRLARGLGLRDYWSMDFRQRWLTCRSG